MPTLVATITDADFSATSSYGINKVVFTLTSSTLGAGSTWGINAPGMHVMVDEANTGESSVTYPTTSSCENAGTGLPITVTGLRPGMPVYVTVNATSGGATLSGTGVYPTTTGSEGEYAGPGHATGGAPTAWESKGVFRSLGLTNAGATLTMVTSRKATYHRTPNGSSSGGVVTNDNWMIKGVHKFMTVSYWDGLINDDYQLWLSVSQPNYGGVIAGTWAFDSIHGTPFVNKTAGEGGEPWSVGVPCLENFGAGAFGVEFTPYVPFQPSTTNVGAFMHVKGPATVQTLSITLGSTYWLMQPCTWTTATLTHPLTPPPVAVGAYGVQTGTPTGPSAAHGVY